ncbi:hypothetical protein ACFX13_043230 [Malus domestica]
MCCFFNQKIRKHPFSRSYRAILPNSFNMVLSSVIVYSTCSLKRPSILYLFTAIGLGHGQFTGRIAFPIRSFFPEVSD